MRMVDFLTGLSIIGFLVCLIALIGYLRAISRRNSFLREMKGIQKSLRELQSGLHVLQVNLRQNQILKHEPFLSRVKIFDVELSWLESEFNSLRDRYVQVQEKIACWEKMNRLKYLVSLLPRSDYNQLISTTTSFEPKIILLNGYLAKALNRTREIAELGWEVSCQIRESLEKYNDCNRIIQALDEHHVHGGYIDEAKIIFNRISPKISSIPQELIMNSKEVIISQTEYATICQAYEVYLEILPIIDSLHLRLNQWWDQYQQTTRTINAAQAALTNTQGLIQESSERIAMGYLLDNLKTIQSIGDILSDTLTRVEIESLPDMMQEAERIQQITFETADTVKQARRNQSILEPLLDQIEAATTQIDEQVTSLSKHPTFPIAWDKSGDRFFSINHREKAIIVEGRLRSPNEIQDHLTIALGLYKEIVELSSRIKQVVLTHEALVSMFHTEEIDQGLFWCQEAKRIIEAAEKFNPANFPKNLSIHFFSSELEGIQRKHQSLLTRLFSDPICESAIQPLLDEMRSLFDAYSVMHEQVAEFKSYLSIFREGENQARQILQKNQPILNQMTSIIRSNPLLSKQGAEKEIDRIKKNLDSCSSKINNVSIGTVENKRMAALAIDRRVEMTCNRWIIYIEKNISVIRDNLRDKLETLDSMANLDDVVIKQARRLLSQTEEKSEGVEPAGSKASIFENPVLHLKAKNDLWQNLVATSSELEETIYNPIFEAYQAALMQKELAMKQLLMATDQIPEKRSWPATSFVMPSLRSNLAAIDLVWKKNISQPMRAIWWVRRFGEIWIKYQEFIHFVITAIETCKDERQAITELEKQLEIIDQKWSSLEQQMVNDRMAAARIRAIKKDIERQYKQIKRRWQFSGSMPGTGPTYGEIKIALSELANRFQTAVVTVNNAGGETFEVGIQGQVETNPENRNSEDLS